MSKFDIVSINEEEREYIIGLFVGDGSFNKGSKEPRSFVRFALDRKRDDDVAFKLTKTIGNSGKRVSLIPLEK